VNSVRERRVEAPDGTSLAVYESGDASAPPLVLVHGYPDNHAVWDALTGPLAERFHVISYDVRGTGASDQPRERSAYRIAQLVADLSAVIDACSPDSPVHLIGHDWGSVQSWAAVTGDQPAARIASFTSISGPCLEYGSAWLRDLRRHPRASLRQIAHSYYVLLFHLPRLPEAALRRGVGERALPSDVPRSDADKINGLELYRANIFPAMRREPTRTRIPVQIIAPLRDPFVTPEFAIDSARPWVDHLTVHTVAAGHWVISRQPDLVAPLITDFAESAG
jgi:pimeloyl-ACP methyl ester carboxylesterase